MYKWSIDINCAQNVVSSDKKILYKNIPDKNKKLPMTKRYRTKKSSFQLDIMYFVPVYFNGNVKDLDYDITLLKYLILTLKTSP